MPAAADEVVAAEEGECNCIHGGIVLSDDATTRSGGKNRHLTDRPIVGEGTESCIDRLVKPDSHVATRSKVLGSFYSRLIAFSDLQLHRRR